MRMQTRSSPSLASLHSLARHVGIVNYHAIPKGVLYKKLKESYNMDRLQRAALRCGKASSSRRESLTERRIRMKEKRSAEGANDGSSSSSTSSSSTASSSSSSTSSSSSISSGSQTELAALDNSNIVLKSATNEKLALMRNRPLKNSKHVEPDIDPVMLTELTSKNIWSYTRNNGTVIKFNVETLTDYMLATGDFSDPETRIQFSDQSLLDIDRTVALYGLSKPSVFEAKYKPGGFDDLKFRRDALCGLERCAGEVVTDMLNIIETCDPEEAQIRLAMRELPAFTDYLTQLRDADPAFAKQCLSHWKTYMRGPPNRPNDDSYGLIDVVVQFMRMAEQAASAVHDDEEDDYDD